MTEPKKARVRTHPVKDVDADQAPSALVAEPPVGYKNPPHHSRFQKGQSGNPRGRPKGSRSIAKILEQGLDERVTVRENGQSRRIKKRELVVKQLIKKAAEGDLKALAHIIRIESEFERRTADALDAGARSTAVPTPERDAEIIAQLLELYDAGDGDPDDDVDQSGDNEEIG